MEERYVISVKARKDLNGNNHEQWRYVDVIDGDFGSRSSPYWSAYSHKIFRSVKSAEEWFNKRKDDLFGICNKKYDFDMDTLAIRKIHYEDTKSLRAD